MVQALKNWINSLFALIRHDQSFWDPKFVPLDIDELDQKRGFSEQAKYYAERGLPSEQDTEPDAGHQIIYKYIYQLGLRLHTIASKRLQEYKTIKPSIHPEEFIERIRSIPASFKHETSFRYSQYKKDHEDISKDLYTTTKDYDQFRLDNGINREPDYPSSKFVYLAIPALLLAFEIVFNSIVFSTASEGLRGGIKLAFIIAFINVIVSAVLGYNVRYLNVRKWYLKIIGILCLIVLVSFIPLNLFIAHFRDAAFALQDIDSMSLLEAMQKQRNLFSSAQEAFLNHPFSLDSPESWGLFIIGCLFFIGSAIDGYKLDEKIPGYSRLHKRIKELNEELISERDKYHKELNAYKEKFLHSLSVAQDNFNSQLRSFMNYFNLCEVISNVYDQQCEEYKQAYLALISLYRAENRAHRKESNPPKYFSDPISPIVMPALIVDLSSDRSVIQNYNAVARQLPIVINKARSEVQKYWGEITTQTNN
jgi:hypothetical protein